MSDSETQLQPAYPAIKFLQHRKIPDLLGYSTLRQPLRGTGTLRERASRVSNCRLGRA
ncbi:MULTISPECIES: hypothetical protein [unclassified Coleofasciculus]|uniref:hypothetical protein n=1 Tax=unclassified Coleofasciculus TaxID=2692782 RepID=UPI0018807115|nr:MULTISPECIES: hypothetical protein [unclassified Coleofasciculus]MBE9127426.1 hypothetical protein [Coleofasciculus sp. LEGE 07081]MBE9149247.1 hypothetical protein [Coleofasciculus sp. LEGE 07092]